MKNNIALFNFVKNLLIQISVYLQTMTVTNSEQQQVDKEL